MTRGTQDVQDTQDTQVAGGELAAAMRAGCLGVRVARLHRLVARAYEQALQPLGVSLPQIEILSLLMAAGGPVKPTVLAAESMAERSTLSRNLALMQAKGWIAVVKTSQTGRTMSVTIAAAGVEVLARATDGWRRLQAATTDALGPDACSTLEGWIDSLAGSPVE